MTQARDLSHFVHHLDGGIARMELAVEGIHCGGCMRTIENGLSAMPDIVRARVNLTDRRVAVEWREGKVDPNGFIDRLSEVSGPIRSIPASPPATNAAKGGSCCAASASPPSPP